MVDGVMKGVTHDYVLSGHFAAPCRTARPTVERRKTTRLNRSWVFSVSRLAAWLRGEFPTSRDHLVDMITADTA
jgi:hypothetical protein